MPTRHPSAVKRHRQSLKRRARNRAIESRVRTDVRKLREAVSGKDLPTAEAQLRVAIKEISKAKSKGVIHRNAASRSISRLSKHVAGLKASAS